MLSSPWSDLHAGGVLSGLTPAIYFRLSVQAMDSGDERRWGGLGFSFGGELPHGFPVGGGGESAEEIEELGGGGGNRRGGGCGPGEEPEGHSTGGEAAAEDAVNEFRVHGEVELVEGAFHEDVAANDVGDVVDCHEVVICVDCWLWVGHWRGVWCRGWWLGF
ncbi:hypothetical protein Acr_26g0003410 [Actinidia rufa]|uniref:Uncharacterized protein n=1 Tax=Actinidia rufa TaxID=165716 RepID=A0A7J0H254_9ERIC|nr:hypothetical protein Acr_26g0003410 [Actinidia rufa]